MRNSHCRKASGDTNGFIPRHRGKPISSANDESKEHGPVYGSFKPRGSSGSYSAAVLVVTVANMLSDSMQFPAGLKYLQRMSVT